MTTKNKILALVSLILVLAVFATACKGKEGASSAEEESAPPVVAEGYPVTIGETVLQDKPERVASLAPSLTEKIYDMNLQDRLVAVSNFCEYPAAAQELPRAGSPQIPNINIIQETGANVVFTTAALPATDAQILEERGVLVVIITQAQSIEEIWQVYATLATALEGSTAGEKLAKETVAPARAWLESLSGAVATEVTATDTLRQGVYVKKLPFVLATGDSVEHEMMEILGIANVAGEKTGWSYPEVDALEGQGRADFEAINVLLFDPRDLTVQDLEQDDFYKTLPAVISDSFIATDSAAMERQGFSMLDGVYDMAIQLWPDATIPLWESGQTGGTADDTPDETDEIEDPGDNDTPDGDPVADTE